MRVRGCFIAISSVLFVGVVPASASVTAPEPVTVPAPPAGKAEIVFFRPSGFAGSAISCAVSENGAKLSSLPPGRFTVILADTGRHTYSVSSEATDQVFFDLKSGDVKYVKCTVQMGFWVGRPKLDVAIQDEFTTKTWKSVDPSRMGSSALTDAQLQAANAAQANAAPAATVAATTPVAAPVATAAAAPVALVAPAAVAPAPAPPAAAPASTAKQPAS